MPVPVIFSSLFILNFNQLFDIGPLTIPSTNQGDVMKCSKELHGRAETRNYSSRVENYFKSEGSVITLVRCAHW